MFCKKCGTGVLVNVTSGFRILASASVSSTRMSVGTLSIEVDSKSVISVYWCPTCKEEVKVEDVIVPCSQCSEETNLPNAYLIKGSGGTYCKKHAEAHADGKKVVLLTTVMKDIHLS